MGLPAQYFTDPEIFRRAKENIFFRTWQYACHASELPAVGDFISFSIGDQNVFVIRNGAGELGAFYNVCQHRGHRLVGDRGRSKGNHQTIVCPYHAWCYELDGKLRGAPNSEVVPGFDRRNIRLASIRLEGFLGLVFINLDADARPLDECYPEVRAEILSVCPHIETLSLAHEHAVNEGCNWLVAVENYNECYHCKTAHADFTRGVIDPATYNIAPFGAGHCLRHTSQATTSDQSWYDVSGSDYASFYLWPAASLQIFPGGVVNSYHWRPLAVDDTEVHRRWYAKDGAITPTLQKIIDLDRTTTFAEDLRLVRNVQRGVTSRGYTPGPLIIDPNGGANSELAIATLHGWVRDEIHL